MSLSQPVIDWVVQIEMLIRGAIIIPSILGLFGTTIASLAFLDDGNEMKKYGSLLKKSFVLCILGIVLFIVLPASDILEALLTVD